MDLPTLPLHELAIRLGLAALCGAIIGAEREWRDRTAGLRTHMLVCVGAAAFTMVSAYAFIDWYVIANSVPGGGLRTDPTRIAAQIVTGIGFLGAGAIFRSDSGISGLTTAASLWAMAAIGMAVGAGEYEIAVGTTLCILIVLVMLRTLGGRIKQHNRASSTPIVVYVTGAEAIGHVLDVIAAAEASISAFSARGRRKHEHGRKLAFELHVRDEESVNQIVGRMAGLDGVESVSVRERSHGDGRSTS